MRGFVLGHFPLVLNGGIASSKLLPSRNHLTDKLTLMRSEPMSDDEKANALTTQPYAYKKKWFILSNISNQNTFHYIEFKDTWRFFLN